MIALGLRLTFAGGRAVIGRLAMIAAAVTLGVTMLLGTLAGVNAVGAQNQRYAWLESDSVAPAPTVRASADPVWWRLSGDYFDGHVVGRVDVAAGGPHAPVPPGLTRVPRPGEYFASPALVTRLRHTPAAQLAARYPGRLAGTIGRAGLPSPDTLLVVVGRTVPAVRSGPGAVPLHAYATVSPSDCHGCGPGIGLNENAMDLVLGVVAAGLLFPVLIFVGTATRLSAARREQRFAAMRLVGATPRQVSAVAAVEATVATAVGVALGFLAFPLLRGVIASIPFTGDRFWPSDLGLSLVDVLGVAIGVPAAAALTARIALRRVRVSPLGVVRRQTPKPPRAWRLVPLALGVGELGVLVAVGPPATGTGQTLAFLAGMITVMVGLLVAGPWLTMKGARLLARRTRRPESLIAGRRLADDPTAAFRAISGLVLALFVGTVAISALAGFVAHRGTPRVDETATGTFDLDLAQFTYAGNGPQLSVASVPASLVTTLAAIPGVRDTALLHTDVTPGPRQFEHPVLITCAELARLDGLGRCARGAQVARISPYLDVVGRLATHVWPAAAVSVAAVRTRPVTNLLVATDGSAGAREAVRTVLENAYPRFRPPQTLGESESHAAAQADTYGRLAEVVVLASLPIAGCSLAVSAVSGLSERRRAFGLLRLAGVPLRRLRTVVALENALPMLAGAVTAIGMGLAAAELFLEAQLGYSLVAPGPGYYISVGAGIALALVVMASTLPFLGRITGPESARNE